MAKRAYGQFCGFARAVEVVGERWALLVLRDLFVGPKRFTDLRRGLARIPTNVLTTRLKELERAGVVRRRVLPRPAGSIVYELTKYGAELEGVILELGRWGAKSLGEPRPNEIVTADSLVMALRSTFRSESAGGLTVAYELRFGPIVVHARVKDGALEAAQGPLADADLIIEAGPAIRALMAGEITPTQAIKSGSVHFTGKAELLARFSDIFQIGSPPSESLSGVEGRGPTPRPAGGRRRRGL